MSGEMTLFGIANLLARSNRYEDAILIYEYLAKKHPDFHPYHENEEETRDLLDRRSPEEGAGRKRQHLPKANDAQRLLRIADALSRYGRPEWVDLCGDADEPGREQLFLAKATSVTRQGAYRWLKFVNRYLSKFGLEQLSLLPKERRLSPHPFLNVRCAQSRRIEGPLVTICVACFNAEPYVEHAIRSLLSQSYHNIEILAFNDRSTDDTLNVLNRLAAEDSRLRVFDNAVNQGTYISRNQAFEMAKGKYFTILDADDFALPDRIERQVKHLEAEPGHVGVVTEWLRVSEDGQFHFKKAWGGCYQHEAVATLMVRTEEVRNKIGYWDAVKFAADTEFHHRLRKVYGYKAVPLLKIPTVLSLYHSASLTNDPNTGISVGGIRGLSPTRLAYRDAWNAWHAEQKADLYIPHPLEKRRFMAPQEMLPFSAS